MFSGGRDSGKTIKASGRSIKATGKTVKTTSRSVKTATRTTEIAVVTAYSGGNSIFVSVGEKGVDYERCTLVRHVME